MAGRPVFTPRPSARAWAARIGLDRHLAMADAMIYATALEAGAHLVTTDAHFQGLPVATVFRAKP